MDTSDVTENCSRNPSPPPEIVEHADLLNAESIGNTAFSKHWLFSTLMKLIEEVDRENEDNSGGESSGDRQRCTELAVDVDDDLQNELCKLWDMSMNADVARFLDEYKGIQIMSGIIEKAKAPRVTEICVGILGNMACEPTVCKAMSENFKFIALVLALLEVRDARTLVETMRLIFTSLSNTGTRGPWIRAIQRSEDVLNHIIFIFSSSTNCDLLKNTADLVDTLLDLEPDLCISWATITFIHSVLEATEQIGNNHTEAFEVYLHIFQSFSTTESGVEALESHIDRLESKILKYLNIVCEYEIVGVDGKEGSLASALSLMHIFLTARPTSQLQHLIKNERFIRILLKILEPLYPMLKKENNECSASSNEEIIDKHQAHDGTAVHQPDSEVTTVNKKEARNRDSVDKNQQDLKAVEIDEKDKFEFKQLELLFDVLSGLLIDYCSILFMEPLTSNFKSLVRHIDNNARGNSSSEADKKRGEKSYVGHVDGTEECVENHDGEITKATSKIDCVPVLEYLNEACSRRRINYFGLTLKNTETGNKLFEKLHELGVNHKMERLCRILGDVKVGKIVNRAESCTAQPDASAVS